MSTAAEVLGKFSAEFTLQDVPPQVIQRAKQCIIDTVAVGIFGERLPWSRMIIDYANRYGSGGPCSILGAPELRVHGPYAALANGLLATAFEHDSIREPGAGAHPGAPLLATVLAACEETHADGNTALAAFIAGCEVMFRVAVASRHSPEKIGFHAPGLTGTYGTAVAAGRVLRLNAEQMTNAIGIAGSLSSGLLAFTKAKQGGMVKRLHLGRAAESGILAARLARSGYTGPETVLEGQFGFLDVYCRGHDSDPALLTSDLRVNWEVMRICLKRYACHMAAHAPVQTLREMMAEYSIKGRDVAHITVEVSTKVLTHHNITEPGDVMQGQYSVPFCIALALFRNPDDAASFDESAIHDSAIRAACRAIELQPRGPEWKSAWGMRMTLKLKDGREFSRKGEIVKGMSDHPLSRDELHRKFTLLTTAMAPGDAEELLQRLESLEEQRRFTLRKELA